MDDILDYEEGASDFVDYLFLQEYQLAAVADVLTEGGVEHRVNKVKSLDNVGFIPTPSETLLNRSDYTIQVQKNSHQKVDYIMARHPELLEDSEEVRKVFLANSLDKEGLIDVLLFPEEWLEGDDLLVIALLATKGIAIPVSEYDQRRIEREKERAVVAKPAFWNNARIFAIVLLVICAIYAIINYFTYVPDIPVSRRGNGLMG